MVGGNSSARLMRQVGVPGCWLGVYLHSVEPLPKRLLVRMKSELLEMMNLVSEPVR